MTTPTEKNKDTEIKENTGPGGFSDQYDNDKMRSMDRDHNPGGVTNVPFEDDIDLTDADFNPDHDEAYTQDLKERHEPSHDRRSD